MAATVNKQLEEPKEIILRGFAYERNGAVYAECIDLDILVRRDSFQSACKALKDAVTGYLETAAAHGRLDEMVHRPSPLSHRLRYHRLVAERALLSGVRRTAALVDCTAKLIDGRPVLAA